MSDFPASFKARLDPASYGFPSRGDDAQPKGGMGQGRGVYQKMPYPTARARGGNIGDLPVQLPRLVSAGRGLSG